MHAGERERERQRQPTQISSGGVHYVEAAATMAMGMGTGTGLTGGSGIERKPTVRKTGLKGCGGAARRRISPSRRRRATFS